jgi:hypothetical protein
MNDLLTTLTKQLDSGFIQKVSQTFGTDAAKTGSVVQKALPFLLGALAKNTDQNGGAQSLIKALEKKHDGSIFDQLDDLIKNPEGGEGVGILEHVLGGKIKEVEHYVGKGSGLNIESVGKIFKTLAPMVMGALGKEQKEKNLGSTEISELIKNSSKAIEIESSLPGDLVMRFLDKDGDGEIKDDLWAMILNQVKKFFRK